MAFTKVATIQEIPPGTAKQVRLGGRMLALFNLDGELHAIDDTCPHRGAPLWEGFVEGKEVTCPWHAARFDIATGAALCLPARASVRVHKVQVIGEEVQVELAT